MDSARFKGIVFDKDGTLIDFNSSWLQASSDAADYLARAAGQPERRDELLREGGLVLTYRGATQGPDSVRKQRSEPLTAADWQANWRADSLLAAGTSEQLLAHWGNVLGVEVSRAQKNSIDRLFRDAATRAVPLVPDLAEWLAEWQRAGLKTGVASMDDTNGITQLLTQFDALDSVDFIVGHDSGYPLKPAPDMLFACCEAFGCQPEELVMVGDSPRDLQMGNHAGAGLVIGVLSGSSGRENLEPWADVVVGSIAELCALSELKGIEPCHDLNR